MSADDQKATETVLALLNDSVIHRIGFRLNSRQISPLMYGLVADAIKDKKIAVLVDPKILEDGTNGTYHSTLKVRDDLILYDVLVLARPDLPGNLNHRFLTASTIIHECTHAGFDLLKLPDMTHLEHEAGAFIAGALFMVAKMLEMGGNPARVNLPQPVLKAAWNIAITIMSKRDPSKEQYNALNVAITSAPRYKDAATTITLNDGVGRPWMLPKAR